MSTPVPAGDLVASTATSRVAAIAATVPGYDAYGARAGRREAERAFRQAIAARVRVARDVIGRAQRRGVAGGRLEEVVRLEEVGRRIGRLIDRLDGPAPVLGDWFLERAREEPVRAAVVSADRLVVAQAEELVATAEALAGAPDASALAADDLAEVVDELEAGLHVRAARLAQPRPPGAGDPAPAAAVCLGDRLVVEGRSYLVSAITWWRRGDRRWILGDRAGGLALWRDPAGELVLFEDQPATTALPPPAELVHGGERFQLAWTDDGSAGHSDRAGRSHRRRPRWLFAGEAGGWLWLEALDGATRLWRGTPVRPEDVEL